MPIMAARVYHRGKLVRDLGPHEALPEDCDPGDFFWLGLFAPTPEELSSIAKRFGLHPLAVEDALKANQLPKVEVYGDQLFVVARTATLDGEAIHAGETALFLGRHFLVSVRHGSARAHTDVRARLESLPAKLAHGPDYVLYAVLDFIVDGYFPVIDAIEDRMLGVEDRVMDTPLSAADIRHLYKQRHEIIRFQRLVGMMKEVAARLANGDELPAIDPVVRPFFRDVWDHVQRAEYRLAGLRDIAVSVIETNGMLEQQRQGAITRQLAAWAAILAVPTAIAGIYGMNFDYMPELRWPFGYPLIVGGMTAICLTLYWRFKRIGWL
ncbi:magnesium and cobalt transport protein CorA [Sphingopyxis alaskensis]|jgi:magnesium transporter|uniref:Magnesium and cobalt transport protein CorA n=1 Tax=Sphingopyxis alaskensis (strain DSM 13593 / LMG 18877 / RB2256) TaxID=317655 RepID=Q1GRB5_SPHAL|nr:magnesium and cobalt transport protein CorA [Sphingopyxis alaskensis]ABF53807.1 magnesium and cobalt transport protein CorA [Sphingopyxis alaskensis RB2256]MCM3419488.1 magnesium and cobalt transport protein CorA [Sphingopyxis alaskensis]